MPADAWAEHRYIHAEMPASDNEIRRKRLFYRAWHRGTREADLILGSFAEAHLADFEAARLDEFEALLDASDVDIFDWINGYAAPPPGYDTEVTRLLLAFRYTPRPT